MSETVRVRFAPSPSGGLHLGNVRTALFNWFLARGSGGSLVLRLEDTDRERSTEEAVAALLEDLDWLGLPFDEGPRVGGPHAPYRQSQRLELYARHLARLEAAGFAYPCFCTEEELAEVKRRCTAEGRPPAYSGRCRRLPPAKRRELRESGRPFAMRFASPGGETVFEDLVRGIVRFSPEAVGDFVLARADGSPTFHFTVVVDDALMGITHVVRGEDHLPNTPRHLQLARALGFEPPKYAHLPLLKGPDGRKLSKRHGEMGVAAYRRSGYPPEGLLNYLALLGWTPPDGVEVRPLEELARLFDLSAVHKGAAVFDPGKLRWVCAQYLAKVPLEDLTRAVLPYLEAAGLFNRNRARESFEWLKAAVDSVRGNLACLSDIQEWAAFYFIDELHFSPATARELLRARAVLEAFEEAFREATGELDAEAFREAGRRAGKKLGLQGRALYHPLRLALTAREAGPELARVVPLLGRERVLARLKVWTEEIPT